MFRFAQLTGVARCYYRSVLAEPGQVPEGWQPRSFTGLSQAEIDAKVEAYKAMAAQEKTKVIYSHLLCRFWLVVSQLLAATEKVRGNGRARIPILFALQEL